MTVTNTYSDTELTTGVKRFRVHSAGKGEGKDTYQIFV